MNGLSLSDFHYILNKEITPFLSLVSLMCFSALFLTFKRLDPNRMYSSPSSDNEDTAIPQSNTVVPFFLFDHIFFFKVKAIFLSMTSTGARHRDRTTTGNVLQEESHSGILAYFFGEDGKRKLTVEEFVTFKRNLQQQVMRLEVGFYSFKTQ